MNNIKLSKRLSTAASFVRSGAFVADIGTDHAYLPIFLVQNKVVTKAIASDINLGPIQKANENIEKFNMQENIKTVIADGLDGIKGFSPTDILICGMGGELISEIIEKSEYVKNPNVRLILQPMSCAYELREYLSRCFNITDEKIVCEDGKIYQIICANYDGQIHKYSKAELELGNINIKEKTNEYKKLLITTIERKKKIFDGLRLGKHNTEEIERELKELEKLKDDVL